MNTTPACSCHHTISFKQGFKDLFLGKMNHWTPRWPKWNWEITTTIHHEVHWISAFADEKNTIAKKQNSFPVLIHHENFKLAGVWVLGIGDGRKDPGPFGSPYPKDRHFVTCHFHFLLHMVSLCFEAVSTEWGKQIPWSFKSYLGIFKQNVQD